MGCDNGFRLTGQCLKDIPPTEDVSHLALNRLDFAFSREPICSSVIFATDNILQDGSLWSQAQVVGSIQKKINSQGREQGEPDASGSSVGDIDGRFGYTILFLVECWGIKKPGRFVHGDNADCSS